MPPSFFSPDLRRFEAGLAALNRGDDEGGEGLHMRREMNLGAAALAACLSLVASLAAFSIAWGDPVSDGEAGLAALNRGDDAQAVQLFTRALDSGLLSPQDRELALVKRAEAFAGQNQSEAALADLQAAIALNPSDSEARNLQAQLIASPSQRTLAQTRTGAPGLMFGAPITGYCVYSERRIFQMSKVGQSVEARMKMLASEANAEPNTAAEELKETQAKENREMESQLQSVLVQLFEQNRCSILFEYGHGIAAVNPAMDLTSQAVAGLDDRIQTLTFDLVHVDPQPGAQPAASR